MPRSRRALLRDSTALVSLGIAGCLGDAGSSPSPTDDPETSEPTTSADGTPPASPDTPSPTYESLPDGRRVDFAEGPKPEPDFPDSLTRESVREFVHTYEHNHVYNSLHYDESSEVSLECEVDGVEERDAYWRVVVSCTASSNTGGDERENGTGTSTVVHADWFTQTYVYLVDEDSVVRRRYEGEE